MELDESRIVKELQRIRRFGIADMALRPNLYPCLSEIRTDSGRGARKINDIIRECQVLFQAAIDLLPSSNLRQAAAILFHLDVSCRAPSLSERRQKADQVYTGANTARHEETIRRTLEKHIDRLMLESLPNVNLSLSDKTDYVEFLGDGKTTLEPLTLSSLSELPNIPSVYAGLTNVFLTRTEFTSENPTGILFDCASHIQMSGISLNLLCQQFADRRLHALIKNGTCIECLFLDPEGASIKLREEEEGLSVGELSALTTININWIKRVRDNLPNEYMPLLRIGVYDQTVRFNFIFIDGDLCVAQPYLPGIRGLDSPTLMVKRLAEPGLYQTFFSSFEWIQKKSVIL